MLLLIYILFLLLKVILFSLIFDLVFLSLPNISFVSFFVLVPIKSFTSGLFSDLPTLSCISRCFCCALVLVGAFITLPLTTCKSFLGCNEPSTVYKSLFTSSTLCVSILKLSLYPLCCLCITGVRTLSPISN